MVHALSSVSPTSNRVRIFFCNAIIATANVSHIEDSIKEGDVGGYERPFNFDKKKFWLASDCLLAPKDSF